MSKNVLTKEAEEEGVTLFSFKISRVVDSRMRASDTLILTSAAAPARISSGIPSPEISRTPQTERVGLSPRGASCEPNHRFYGPVIEGWQSESLE